MRQVLNQIKNKGNEDSAQQKLLKESMKLEAQRQQKAGICDPVYEKMI